MKKILIGFLLLSSSVLPAQNITLSDQAEISVITCGPSQDQLFTAFGHSAFRVFDPVLGIDDAYNYGVFDFDQPNFYINFARGYNYYMLAVQDYKRFEYIYIYYNRYLHEQVLNLSPFQKQKLFDYLQWNALPENQAYRYDYFYDNCATKIPEIVLKVFSDSVVFDGLYIKNQYTIRELTDLYLTQQPWGDLGIDIGLGLPTDKKATPYEYMFLPDFVESGFDNATIARGDTTLRLVKEKRIIYASREEDVKHTFPHPLIVFSVFALIALAITIFDLKRKRLSTWYDATLFAVTGSLGLLLFLLWVATDHAAASNNFNILWALPTHLIAAIAFIRQPAWLKPYFLVVAVMTVIVLIGWPFLPQRLNYSLIPFVITLSMRAMAQYLVRRPLQRI